MPLEETNAKSKDLVDRRPLSPYPVLTRPAAILTLDHPDLVNWPLMHSNSKHLVRVLVGKVQSRGLELVPDLVCHDGKSTLFLKFEHDSGFMSLLVALGPRCEVDLGSNPSLAGVISAFKFCVIESSISPLDIRRKSTKKD